MIVLGVVATAAFGQADLIIEGTDGIDLLNGTPAAESIYARAGDDTVNGGPGDDELDGGPGGDVLNGGAGSDSVAYGGATAVSVTLDGTKNDGVAGEGDNVGADVEDLFGGDGNDKLDGNTRVNTIDGSAGDDRITGGSGKDALFGGDGDDSMRAQDGEVDRIDCGAGADTAELDRTDSHRSCETLIFPPKPDDLTLFRPRRLVIGSIDRGSTIVIACASGCKPALSPSKRLIRRRSVRGPVVNITLPRRTSGATLENGVTSGGRTACARFRVGKNFRSFKILRGQRCTTVARLKGS